MSYTPITSWENPGVVNTALLARGLATNEYPLDTDFNFMYYALTRGINLAGKAILEDDSFKFDSVEFPIAEASLVFDDEAVTVSLNDDDSLRITNPSGMPVVGYVKVLVATKKEGNTSKVITDIIISGKPRYGTLTRKVPMSEIVNAIDSTKYDKIIYDKNLEVSQGLPTTMGVFFAFNPDTDTRELDFPVSIPSGCTSMVLGDLRVNIGRVVPSGGTVSFANYEKLTTIMREYSNVPYQSAFPSVTGATRSFGFAGAYPNGVTFSPGSTELPMQVGSQLALTPVRPISVANKNNGAIDYKGQSFPVNYLINLGLDATNSYDDSSKRTSFAYTSGKATSSSSSTVNYHQLVTQEVLAKKLLTMYTEESLAEKVKEDVVLTEDLEKYQKTEDTANWQKTKVVPDNYANSAINGSSKAVIYPMLNNLVTNGKILERGLIHDTYSIRSLTNLVKAGMLGLGVSSEFNSYYTPYDSASPKGITLNPYIIDHRDGKVLALNNPKALISPTDSSMYNPYSTVVSSGVDALGGGAKMRAIYNKDTDLLVVEFKSSSTTSRIGGSSTSTLSVPVKLPTVILYVRGFSNLKDTDDWISSNVTLRMYYNHSNLVDQPVNSDDIRFIESVGSRTSDLLSENAKLLTNMKRTIYTDESSLKSFGELIFDGDFSDIGTGTMVYLARSPLEYTHFKILYRITGYEGYIIVPRAMSTTGGRFTINNSYRNMGDSAPHALTVFQPQIQISASIETIEDPTGLGGDPMSVYALTFTHVSKWYLNTSTESGGAYTTNTTMRLLKVFGINRNVITPNWSPTNFGITVTHTLE